MAPMGTRVLKVIDSEFEWQVDPGDPERWYLYGMNAALARVYIVQRGAHDFFWVNEDDNQSGVAKSWRKAALAAIFADCRSE